MTKIKNTPSNMPKVKQESSHDYLFFEYGVDIPSRTIYLGSQSMDWEGGETGVDFMMAERFIKSIYLLDQKDGDINIISNNPGGDWYHGMAIFDAIKGARNKIKMTVFGYAMSMGSVILQAADERVMSPNSSMMIHYGYSGMGANHPKIVEAWSNEDKKLNKVMEQIYLEKMRVVNPEFRLEKLRKMLNFDTFFTADQAIELGLADSVL